MEHAHPIVFRMESVWPGQLGRIEMHRTRAGGDLSHIAPARSHMNRFLVGGSDWKTRLEEDIRRASHLNQRQAYAAKRKKSRRKEAEAIRRNGPQDPWRREREHGPLREFVLTASRAFFESEVPGFPDAEKVQAFRDAAISFFKAEMGAALVAAWEDHDEEAYHVHGVLAAWVETESKSSGRQRRLEPSALRIVKSYESAQDIVAEHFADLGLVRGERRAERRRQALQEERDAGLPREHTPCHEWRADEAVRVSEERRAAERARAEATERENAAAELYEAAEARASEFEDWEVELEHRDAMLAAREREADERDRDLSRRERWLKDVLGALQSLGGKIRDAARRLGLLRDPEIEAAIAAADRVREIERGDPSPRDGSPALSTQSRR